MKKKLVKIMAVSAMAIMVFGGSALAGQSYENYSTTIRGFNGSGYTGYQTKSVSGKNGSLKSNTVGGKYVVDARMRSTAGTGSWTRNITDKNTYTLSAHSGQHNGCNVRVELSNDINTPVSVQADGQWKSN